MAIQNKRFEYVNDLIKSIDASNFYKCYYDYCLESNVKSAEFLILSGVPINTTGPMGMPSDNLADLALKSSNLDMTKLCVKYDLIEFPISDNIILDKHIKAEIYKFYLWHNRSGIAYARYYVPFVQKISKNMFREIITYF